MPFNNACLLALIFSLKVSTVFVFGISTVKICCGGVPNTQQLSSNIMVIVARNLNANADKGSFNNLPLKTVSLGSGVEY
jgi:hypothetical protein